MTTYRRNSANQLAGFTLVEILIVIVIIGLLAGMTTTVLVSARRSVNNSLVTTQMAQLSIALDEYRNRYGEYPPDLSDEASVMRHIRKRWPRYNVTYPKFLEHIRYGCLLSSSGYSGSNGPASLSELCDPSNFGRPRHVWECKAYLSSVVFWLGGLPDKNGNPSGFFASPKYPLGISPSSDEPIKYPGRAKKEKPLFTFDRKFLGRFRSDAYDSVDNYYFNVDDSGQLLDSSLNAYVYIPAFCQGNYPIVYFRPTVSSPYLDKHFFFAQSEGDVDNVSCAVPYMRDGAGWYEEKRFQLVHPGDDGLFGNNLYGNPRIVVKENRGTNDAITLEDADNLANFVESGTLESLYD